MYFPVATAPEPVVVAVGVLPVVPDVDEPAVSSGFEHPTASAAATAKKRRALMVGLVWRLEAGLSTPAGAIGQKPLTQAGRE